MRAALAIAMVTALGSPAAVAQQLDVTITNPLQIIDQAELVREFDIAPNDTLGVQNSFFELESLGITFDDGKLSAGDFEIWTLPDVSALAASAAEITADFEGAIKLRELLSEPKGAVTFQSKLGSAVDLVESASGVAQETLAQWRTAAIRPEMLAGFQENSNAIASSAGAFLDMLRMSNGVPVSGVDPYPEAVMLRGLKPSGQAEVCSGVAVAPRLIVTAAHCLCIMTVTDIYVGRSPADPNVLRLAPERTATFLQCSIFESEAAFGQNIGKGDIGVITIGQDLPPMPFAKFASDQTLQFIRSIRAVGFGASNVIGESEFMLRGKYAADIVVASADCRDIALLFPDTDYRCQATHEMIAAGDTDTCRGDSGGPAFVFSLNREMHLGAITSRSVDPEGSCGSGGIYVKLNQPQFKQWLLQQGVPQSAWAQ